MLNRATSRFPAVLIGGPPHAGKSVLARSLKEELTKAGIQHYLLRAAPDGEGDWFHEAPPDVAKAKRRKGRFTPTWVEQMCRDIAYRPLPFLVDVGGKPQPWQEDIFDQCSHAVLLITDAETQAYWQAMMEKYNVPIIAILTSRLHGESVLEVEYPILQGVMTHLERGQLAQGAVFEALVARIKALFNYTYDELLNIHQQQAPTDLVVDLVRLYKQLNPDRPGYEWRSPDLPAILDYLPQAASLALYGRGPAWLYASVANYIFPNSFYQFDARRGWVEPVTFTDKTPPNPALTFTTQQTERYLHLKVDLPKDYLEYEPELALSLPPVLPNQGVILEGKLPNWLYTGLTLFYRQATWVAIYYPHLHHAVVVASPQTGSQYTVGYAFEITDKK
jgi:CRISPR-associated protein Csx3